MKKISTLISLISLIQLFFISFSFASHEKLVLRLNGKQFRGENILKLKKMISREYSYINFENINLIKVKLIAKTKRGRGEASLVVGRHESYPQTVDGRPEDFFSNDRYTYDRILFNNPSYDSRGKWKIHLKGKFKIRKVVLFVERDNYYNGGKRLVLDYFNREFRGHNTLYLKRKIMEEYGDRFDFDRIRELNIKSIILVAKSRRGRGSATLRVGENNSRSYRIERSYEDFHSNDITSYNRIELENNFRRRHENRGPLQILLEGNIKVKKVIVILKKNREFF